MISKNIVLSPEEVNEKKGVIVLPFGEYERMKEDFNIVRSKLIRKKIARARKEAREGKIITFEQVRKNLSL